MTLFGEMRNELILLDGGELHYQPEWLDGHAADSLLSGLLAAVEWEQPELLLGGESVPVPRLVAWYADPGICYCYSGHTHRPRPWTPLLTQIRSRIEQAVGQSFNGVLLNLYRDGSDAMGWHSDDEPELGRNPVIASLSLGCERRFDLRRCGEGAMRHSLWLQHGSLLVMRGETQHNWQHRIARCSKTLRPRLNLTFRHLRAGVERPDGR